MRAEIEALLTDFEGERAVTVAPSGIGGTAVIGVIASSRCRTELANCADCQRPRKLETGFLGSQIERTRTRTEIVIVDGWRSEALLVSDLNWRLEWPFVD